MMKATSRINENGRVVIPAELRKALDIKAGDELVFRIEDDELRVTSLRQAIRRAQRLVRKYVPEGVSLSDELIRDRRAEAERE